MDRPDNACKSYRHRRLYEREESHFKRGVVYKSILSLSDRWGWDRKKTRRFLDTLEGEKMVTTVTTTKGTTITIVNYGFYQDSGTTDGTTDNSSVGQQLPISNNTNNSNNVNKVNNKRCLGENKNVFLTDEEISKLESEYPDIWRRKLEDLSNYMVMSGKKYNSHYHAIIRFIKNDNEKKGGEVIDSEQRKYKHAEDLL